MTHSKSDNVFNWQKGLFALMDKFVITDESSPFNWVGSVGAGPCIIILVHAIDQSGKKMVGCGHLSDSRSPLSICSMLDKMNASQILSGIIRNGIKLLPEWSSTLLFPDKARACY